jgi:tetratricopeptide (TPR) repeat protein
MKATIKKASHPTKRSSRVSCPDRIINIVLPLIFLLLPAFFFNLSWQGSGLDRLFLLAILTIIGLFAWLSKILLSGSITWHWRKFDWLAPAVLVSASVATFWSPVWRNSLFGGYGQPMRSLVFIWLIFFLYLLIVNNWSAQIRQWCWLALVVSFSFITIYSTCQLSGLFLVPLSFTKSIGFNPIGSLSNLALFLGAAVPFFLLVFDHGDYFCRHKINKRGRLFWNIWLGLSLIAAFIALASLGSFTIWPIIILGLLIVLVFGLMRLIKFTASQLTVISGSLVISFILLVMGNFGWMKLNLPSEVSLSRGFSWQIAKTSLMQRPLFGNGLASFNSVFSRFKTADFNTAALWNLDFDLPAGWLAESLVVLGGLGTLLLLAGLIWGLVIAWRNLLVVKTKLEVQDVDFGVSLLAATIVLMVGGLLVPFGNSLLFIFSLLWILLMVLTFEWSRRKFVYVWRKTDQRSSALWAAVFIIVTIGLLSGLVYGGKVYCADVIAYQSIRVQPVDKQIAKMAIAQRLAPWREIYGFSLAQMSWIKANQIATEAAQATGTVALEAQTNSRAYVQQAKQLLDQNIKFIQRQSASLKTAASLYEMIGDLDSALVIYQQLVKIDPNNPWSYGKIAQIDVAKAYQVSAKEDKDKLVAEALAGYQKALELKPNWAGIYFYRANLYQAIQKPLEATQDLVQAVNYSNGLSDYTLALAQLLNERAKTEPEQAVELRNQAQQILQGILATDNNINALYILTIVYRDAGQTDLARQAAQDLLTRAQETDKPTIQQQFADLLQ